MENINPFIIAGYVSPVRLCVLSLPVANAGLFHKYFSTQITPILKMNADY
ncbi:MAG: hypothetical protein LBN71_05555 [Tannerella sp.]|nr:hypothetical protein [Tannerella sp.]